MSHSSSGPGVFYQVMPGVTSDGKKVMKLIPGVLVNGKFVQSQTMQGLQTGVAPQKLLSLNGSPAQTAKRIVLDPPFTQQVINKVSLMNSTSSPVTMKGNHVQNKQLTQQKYIFVNKPLGALDTAVPAVQMVQSSSRGQNVQLQNQKYFILKPPSASAAPVPPVKELPVTVKSVSRPGGILLNTELKTVSVSGLQPITKKQLPSSNSHSGSMSDPGSSLSDVLSVTPITTAKPKAAPTSPKEPIQSSYKYFPGPGLQGATKQLKLVQKTPQGHGGPCKWVIEEMDAAAPEDLSPVAPNAPSAMVGKTKLVKQHTGRVGTDSNSRPPRRMSAGGDAVVVFNGRVCAVANKSIDSSVTHKLSKPLLEPHEEKRNTSGGTPDQFTEVIDLCEDDDNGLSPSSQDEDNVIFVSYLPPKPGDPDVHGAEQSCKQVGCAAGSEAQESRSPEALTPLRQEGEEEEEIAVKEAGEKVEQVGVEKSTVEVMVQVEVVEEALKEEHTIGGTEVRQQSPLCFVICTVIR